MIEKKNIKVNPKLLDFIDNEVLKDLNINFESFWNGFSDIVDVYFPQNINLLTKRKNLQDKINNWHKKNKSKDFNLDEYKKFLIDIKYIVEEGPDFKIRTSNVDEEISTICGPQLVVPITNARFAINAVNARWGSLYDALYGTDVLGEIPKGNVYDPERGRKVVKFAKSHLDKFVPLDNVKWDEITSIKLNNNKIILSNSNNTNINLKKTNQIIGWILSENSSLRELILSKNNLHCRILINKNDPIGILGLFIPALALLIAAETALTASN